MKSQAADAHGRRNDRLPRRIVVVKKERLAGPQYGRIRTTDYGGLRRILSYLLQIADYQYLHLI